MSSRTTRVLAASLAAVGLTIASAVGLATSAQAATTYTGFIPTAFEQLNYQYGNSAVSPDGTIQAIFAYDNSTVVFVHTADDSVQVVTDSNSDIASGYYGAFSPDGKTLYVSNYDDEKIVIIDVATASVTGTIATQNSENLAVGVSPDGTKLVLGDDYDYVTVFDITNNYNQLGYSGADGGYITNWVFPDSSHAYSIDYYGVIERWDLSNAGQLDSYTAAGSYSTYGQCVTPDLSTLIAQSGTDVIFDNLSDGSNIATLDLSASASNLVHCAVTPDGKKVLVTDWGQDAPGHVYVIDVATHALDETVVTTDVAYTDGISIMKGCKVYADGQATNIAILQLDTTHCPAALPDTGANTSVIGTSIAFSAGLLVAGAIAIIVVRRRRHS